MGATVKRVGSDFVEFEHDGETVRIQVFEGGNDNAHGGGGRRYGGGEWQGRSRGNRSRRNRDVPTPESEATDAAASDPSPPG